MKLNNILFVKLKISSIEDIHIPFLLQETYELGNKYNINLYDILDEKNYRESSKILILFNTFPY
jgi:hypothetical protein